MSLNLSMKVSLSINGSLVNPQTDMSCRYTMLMKYEVRKILADNVAKLMASRPDLDSQQKLRRKAGGKLGQATISRILRCESAATIDNIQAIAEAFGMDAWQLLVPGLDPSITPTLQAVSPRELELYRRIAEAAKDLVEEKPAQ